MTALKFEHLSTERRKKEEEQENQGGSKTSLVFNALTAMKFQTFRTKGGEESKEQEIRQDRRQDEQESLIASIR
jgi:hypothetical protein